MTQFCRPFCPDMFHCRLIEDGEFRPPPYVNIRESIWLCPCKIQPPEEGSCSCIGACDSHCVNRLVWFECVGEGPAGTTFTNCNIGPSCGNRALQEGVRRNLIPYRSPGMGWGLRTGEHIKRGELVIEYVGEVVDEETMLRRTREAAARNDDHVYMMEINSNAIIDARFKGNMSRFINHSCDPNCQLEKWNVNGIMRIGIFALRDILPDEPLSYDYQLWSQARVRCACGASNCRGYLGSEGRHDGRAEMRRSVAEEAARRRAVAASPKDRQSMLRQMRAQERRAQQQAERAELKRQKRLHHTSATLPGDPTSEIRRGPVPRDLEVRNG